MRNFLVKLLCCFIPGKKNRRAVRVALSRNKYDIILEKIADLSIAQEQKIDSTVQKFQQNIKNIYEKIDSVSKNVDFANYIGITNRDNLNFVSGSIRTLLPDVKDISISNGWLRKIHAAGGKLLELVDIICKDHKINYFLYAGSLIGAKLYGHSIPWDDDWDIGMTRADWEKFRQICEDLLEGSEYKPLFIGFSIQMQFRDTVIRGDVFPFDQYSADIKTKEEYEILQQKLLTAKEHCDWAWWHWEEAFENPIKRTVKILHKNDYEKTKQVFEKYVLEGKKPASKGVLLENAVNPGIFFDGKRSFYTSPNNIYRYDWIFPLKKIKYENITVLAPNNIDALLRQKFGDYVQWPNTLENHNLSKNVDSFMMEEIEEFLTRDMHAEYKRLKQEYNKRKAKK